MQLLIIKTFCKYIQYTVLGNIIMFINNWSRVYLRSSLKSKFKGKFKIKVCNKIGQITVKLLQIESPVLF